MLVLVLTVVVVVVVVVVVLVAVVTVHSSLFVSIPKSQKKPLTQKVARQIVANFDGRRLERCGPGVLPDSRFG